MLGRLEKLEIRDVWKHEALDFTNWLAKEKNIELLSETIGIDIEIIETEASVGSFNVDIFAKDTNTNSKIIIENQLERTDHDHLGKIITYASGYDAETIIWLVRDARDEHKKAIEWLNNHLDEKINIFLINIEVWKIGDSKPAPIFRIIESPNNWAKIIKESSNRGSKSNITETKNLQLEFWTSLKEYGEDNSISLKYKSPRPQHWYTFSTGSSAYIVSITVNSREKRIGVEIYINKSKELFKRFEKNKEFIENELEVSFDWMELPEKKASRIILYKDFDIMNKELWNEIHIWSLKKVEAMIKVFSKYR